EMVGLEAILKVAVVETAGVVVGQKAKVVVVMVPMGGTGGRQAEADGMVKALVATGKLAGQEHLFIELSDLFQKDFTISMA
ncbi:MAG: hypothetical protein JKX70_01210, partial [Phycisphaerales bacterium]|nr:hypothetical protein [Phycisphaerales bacterium]